MSGLWGGGPLGKELPRPKWTVALLWILGLVLWIAIAVIILRGVGPDVRWWTDELTLTLIGGLTLGALAIGLALLIKYQFSVAVSAKLMERMLRDYVERKSDEAATDIEAGGASQHAEIVSLLAEIMENTLLDDVEKAAKRKSAKKQRQQALRREIEALTKAGKFREARERLEEFGSRYPDDQALSELQSQLSEALRQHEQHEIASIGEQVQRYMGLGFWERAMEAAVALAEQFPENPDAAKLPDTVRLEQEAGFRAEQQRMYHEIEHLVVRKHWRQAVCAAETLVERHPESPEAARLRDQIEELRRNAAIAERKEWETRIAQHVQTGRHLEAYNLAVELMNKYPDSPQADDIRKRLDQLKARAGIR